MTEAKNDWIQTYSGKQFFPLAPTIESIDLQDIAHALSNICRFTGHTKTFYNVAQHSILVSLNVSKSAALWGLMHDAAEAYIGDLSRPLKKCFRFLMGRIVDDVEDKIASVIRDRFEIFYDEEIHAEVKRADNLLLATESRDFMSPTHPEWKYASGNGFEVLPEQIIPWSPGRSCYEFTKRFNFLMEKNQ